VAVAQPFLFIICCWYNSTVILLVWEW
jgi:hypothetical protein